MELNFKGCCMHLYENWLYFWPESISNYAISLGLDCTFDQQVLLVMPCGNHTVTWLSVMSLGGLWHMSMVKGHSLLLTLQHAWLDLLSTHISILLSHLLNRFQLHCTHMSLKEHILHRNAEQMCEDIMREALTLNMQGKGKKNTQPRKHLSAITSVMPRFRSFQTCDVNFSLNDVTRQNNPGECSLRFCLS